MGVSGGIKTALKEGITCQISAKSEAKDDSERNGKMQHISPQVSDCL